jgi:hypothetical protein
MLLIIVKRIVEGLCFVEKINKDIDGFYDDFFGALSVSLTVAEEVSGSLALTALKWFLMELQPFKQFANTHFNKYVSIC